MQFNSYEYVLMFLPLVVVLYFLSNKIHSNAGKVLLIISSFIFYTDMRFMAAKVLAISLVVNFLFAKVIERSPKKHLQIAMVVPVAVNVILLLYFKYTNFLIDNVNSVLGTNIPLRELILPLGISFFTFQQIAYIVSVYRGEIKKTGMDYFLYILYFPKILMGPLMEPVDFITQINDDSLKRPRSENIVAGLQIFSFGLFKKVMLADVFARGVAWSFANLDSATSMDLVLTMLFYTFEIYFDFSGYSDMAIGSSLMMNIQLPINFDSPYRAISVRDFWKRWHISLTRFFTKYIYIPLGGSRKGKIFTYLNTLIVFLISGIWHGANWTFILWGLIYGVLMVADRILDRYESKVFRPIRWGVTFGVVNILWLLFRSDSVQQWCEILGKIFTFQSADISEALTSSFILPESILISDLFRLTSVTENVQGFWMYAYLFAAFVICLVPNNNYRNLRKIGGLSVLIAALAFVWATLGLGSESVFVYFNF